MADAPKPLGPYKLVTVNTAPERAKRLVGRVVEDVKNEYTIIHAGNAESKFPLLLSAPSFPGRDKCTHAYQWTGIDEVKALVEKIQPDVLVSTQKTN